MQAENISNRLYKKRARKDLVVLEDNLKRTLNDALERGVLPEELYISFNRLINCLHID